MSDDEMLPTLIELAVSGSLPIDQAIQKAYEYGKICGNIDGLKSGLAVIGKVPA